MTIIFSQFSGLVFHRLVQPSFLVDCHVPKTVSVPLDGRYVTSTVPIPFLTPVMTRHQKGVNVSVSWLLPSNL